ncbi:MAG TPA: helix-turn-helix transcriptional regulator [Candidatus Saccharimonadales bacterium]
MNTDQTNILTGKRIRKYRKDLGLSQAALADRADLPPNTIARLNVSGNYQVSFAGD